MVPVVIVVDLNPKFLLCEWEEEKVSKKEKYESVGTSTLRQIQHGVIWIALELFWNYTRSALTANVNVRKS